MFRIGLFIIGLLLNAQVFSKKYELSVFLDYRDCINCSSALGALSKTPRNLQVTILTDKENFHITPDFLRQHGIDPSHLNIKTTSSKPTAGSYFDLHLGKQTILHAPLKDLWSSMATIQSIVNASNEFTSTTILQPPKLSDRVDYFTDGRDYVVTDYLTGRCYKLEVGSKSVSVSEIRFDDAFRREVMDSLGIDSSMYNHVAPILDQIGKRAVRIKSAFLSSQQIYLGTGITLPVVEVNGDTALAEFNLIVRVSSDSVSDYWFVNPDVLNRTNGHSMDIDDIFVVRGDSSVTIPLFKSMEDSSTTYLVATSMISNGRLIHAEMGALRRPSWYDSLNYQHHFSNLGMNSSLCFMRSYPAVAANDATWSSDFKDVLEGYFGKKLGPRIFPFNFLDWRLISENTLAVALVCNAQCSVVFIDTKNNHVLHEISFKGMNLALGSLRISADGHLTALNGDKTRVLSNRPITP